MSEEIPTSEQTKEAEFRKSLSEITTKVFARFLKEKGISQDCKMCGHDHLSLPQVQLYNKTTGMPFLGKHIHYEHALYGDETEFSPENYEYSMICDNCGYTVKFNTGIVLKWHLESEDDNNE